MKDKKETIVKNKNKAFSSYAQYSGIAFQMIAIIGVGTYLGTLGDTYFNTSKPFLTAGLALFSVLMALLMAIRQFVSNANNKQE